MAEGTGSKNNKEQSLRLIGRPPPEATDEYELRTLRFPRQPMQGKLSHFLKMHWRKMWKTIKTHYTWQK